MNTVDTPPPRNNLLTKKGRNALMTALISCQLAVSIWEKGHPQMLLLRGNFKTLIEMRFDMSALALRTYFAV